MVVAALTVHLPNGFFMDWFGNQQGEGFEYHILAAGIALALLVKGAGALSLDRLLTGRRGAPFDTARSSISKIRGRGINRPGSGDS